uniref:Uncharacterized protein n=1 Tax=Triticum urartu TaxID=4572 RepID=A0A8R7RD89_TRIUA
AAVLGLVVPPQLLHGLAHNLQEVVVAVAVLEPLVEHRHEPRPQLVAVVQEPRRHVIARVPAVPLPRLQPVRRRIAGTQPDEVGHPLVDPTVSLVRVLLPPLPHVRHLVVQQPRHQRPHVAGDVVDVARVERDAALAVAFEGEDVGVYEVDDELDAVVHGGSAVLGRRLVEDFPGEEGGLRHDLHRVPHAVFLVEALPAGGRRRVVHCREPHAGSRGGEAGDHE